MVFAYLRLDELLMFPTFQLLKQDVEQQQPVYDKVMQDGHAVLNGTKQGLGREELKSKLDDSKKRWEEVRRSTDQRTAELDELYPKSKSFYDNAVTFSCWLMKAEKFKADLIDVQLTAERDMIEERNLQIQV